LSLLKLLDEKTALGNFQGPLLLIRVEPTMAENTVTKPFVPAVRFPGCYASVLDVHVGTSSTPREETQLAQDVATAWHTTSLDRRHQRGTVDYKLGISLEAWRGSELEKSVKLNPTLHDCGSARKSEGQSNNFLRPSSKLPSRTTGTAAKDVLPINFAGDLSKELHS
jgi:hypothetical protein